MEIKKMKLGFVLFDGRSGSTLLCKKLHQYSDVYISPESSFASRVLGTDISKYSSGKELIEFLSSESQFRHLKLDLEHLENRFNSLISKGNLNSQSSIEVIVDELSSNVPENSIFLIKHSPNEYINTINNLLKNVVFLHIVRDPRGVFASKKKAITVKGNVFSNNPVKTALKWKHKLKNIKSYQEENIFSVKYEDLLLDEKKVIDNVLDFLCSKKIISPNKNYDEIIGEDQKHLHANINKGNITENVYNWKSRTSHYEQAIIYLLCSQEIKSLGYPTTNTKNVTTYFYFVYYLVLYSVISLRSLITNFFKDKSEFKIRLKYIYNLFKS